MGRTLGMAAAVLMVLVGGLWTLQGLGYVGGSSMSGDDTWAIIGPLVAGLGIALAITVARGSRHR